MGVSVSRLGDLSTGHDGIFNPRPSAQGSPKTFADGLAVHRLGDLWVNHTIPHVTSPDSTIGASGKCFADGVGVARVGDPISCGDAIAQGSGKTFSV